MNRFSSVKKILFKSVLVEENGVEAPDMPKIISKLENDNILSIKLKIF